MQTPSLRQSLSRGRKDSFRGSPPSPPAKKARFQSYASPLDGNLFLPSLPDGANDSPSWIENQHDCDAPPTVGLTIRRRRHCSNEKGITSGLDLIPDSPPKKRVVASYSVPREEMSLISLIQAADRM
eukprot:scaffold363_cov56-Cylindrotheca_fusiformis.AAC.7